VAQQAIRFTFGINEGINSGLRCGEFRVWCSRDDTYIAERHTAGIWKASLHGDVAWRTAETRESFESHDARLKGAPGRAPWEYQPTSFDGGRRLAFVIGMTRVAMMRESPADRYLLMPIQDRWDRLWTANIWMSEPGALPNEVDRVGPVLRLANGRGVWVVAGSEALPAIAPEPLPTSTMIKPLSPEYDGVRAPGWMVVGVHLGGGQL
jgi:hypothetical protein